MGQTKCDNCKDVHFTIKDSTCVQCGIDIKINKYISKKTSKCSNCLLIKSKKNKITDNEIILAYNQFPTMTAASKYLKMTRSNFTKRAVELGCHIILKDSA